MRNRICKVCGEHLPPYRMFSCYECEEMVEELEDDRAEQKRDIERDDEVLN